MTSTANQPNISNSVSPVEPDVLIPNLQTISSPTVHQVIINPSVETNDNSTLSLTQHDSPGCSHCPAGAEKPVRKEFFALSPEEIRPISKSNKTTARISKRRGKTAILTESPSF
ncbi:unnamed protein product [Macrosiphum euphorbiae]|uniref:Uncharacterized protein n=1 Tax=Macrosiphum euphorbiae TaxID=13131 RepID=A0AAV0XUM1_9HEMI|nr:unnamed protein product [Macrosiphum euphorbiae]